MNSAALALGFSTCLVLTVTAGGQEAAPHPDLGTEPVTSAMCAECHSDVQEPMQKGGHAPLVAQCHLCHDIKEGAASPYLRMADAQLCHKCHRLPVQQGAPPLQVVEIAPGVTVARELLPMTRQVRVDERLRGHPVSNHPVANVPDPLHPGRQLSCRTCHVAHGAAPRMLAFELKPGENICRKCHDM